jgi:hypothetical protein
MRETNGWSQACHHAQPRSFFQNKTYRYIYVKNQLTSCSLSQWQSNKQQDLFCTQTQLPSIAVLQNNNALKIFQEEKDILMKQNELWHSGTVGCDNVLLGGGVDQKHFKGTKCLHVPGFRGPPSNTVSHPKDLLFTVTGMSLHHIFCLQ